MKKGIIFLIFSVFIAYTNGYSQTKKTGKGTKPAATKTSVSSAQDIAQGKALLSKSDCLACHKLTEKLVGPAYSDIAKKYPATQANITLLGKKVINGGSGVWGPIPMAAHPALTQLNAEKVVKYILSLK